MAKFQKGSGGRPKGIPNKLSASVRESVLAAFQKLQEDEKYNLEAWAKDNTTEFYKIAAKLIPTEIKASVTSTSYNFTITQDAGCDPITDQS